MNETMDLGYYHNMKWNYEWVDLQNIDRMIAECWRMNSQQLQAYYEQLYQQQDLMFAGDLGLAFMKLTGKIASGEIKNNWSGMQKDIHTIQKLIQRGMQWNKEEWLAQYQELQQKRSTYFHTELGQAFLLILERQLEIGVTEEQKLLRQDIRQIKKICDSCDFEKEEDIARVSTLLERNQDRIFSSWLGEGFLKQFQERFAKQEELPKMSRREKRKQEKQEKKQAKQAAKQQKSAAKKAVSGDADINNTEISLEQLQEVAALLTEEPADNKNHNRKHVLKKKLLLSLLFCISAGCMCIWLYLQAERSESLMGLQRLSDQDVISVNESDTFAYDADSGGQEPEESGTGTEAASAGAGAFSMQTDAEKALDVTAQTGEPEEPEPPEVLPQYKKLYQKYPDLFGWLTIEDTVIDFPVMRCMTDEYEYYYLHHDYTGKKNMEGSVFVDRNSSLFPLDNNLVLYGHNMRNGHIFGTLKQYEDEDFYKAHQMISFDTIYEEGTYEVVAVVLTRILYQDEEGFRYYRLFNYTDKKEFKECLEFVKENQIFDTGKKIHYGEQLLMLSTCESSQVNGRLVVVAKKV